MRVKERIKKIKSFFADNVKKVIAPWFNQETMQDECNSIKDHSYHAAEILKIIFNFSTNPKYIFMLKNHVLEDYGHDKVTNHGWLYKSATHLAQDYTRWKGETISRSQCQRVLSILVCKGILRRKRIGSNTKGIHHSTYQYRLNWKVFHEVFNIPLIPLCELKKTKAPSCAKSVTPRYKNTEKLNTSYLEKKEIHRHSAGKGRERHSGLDLAALVKDWQALAASVGVKEGNLWRCKKAFEEKWISRRWKAVSTNGWIRNWDGWCANWVQKFQEQFGYKRKIYTEPLSYFRVLNESVPNHKQIRKKDFSFHEKELLTPVVREFQITDGKETLLDLLAEQALKADNNGTILSLNEWNSLRKNYENSHGLP